MNCLDKYLKYLETEKKENFSKNERRRECEKLVIKGQALLNNLERDVALVNDSDIRKIFSLINDVDVVKIIAELKNIKVFSKYFNDLRFMNQPQVVIAKNNLEKIKNKLKDCLVALEKMIADITLVNEEEINYQINLVKKIKKREVLSLDDVKKFYQMLIVCSDKDINVNQIIMDVVIYINELLSKQLVEKKNAKQKEVMKERVCEVELVIEPVKEVRQLNNLTKEELEEIDRYKDIIEKIFKIGNKYHIDNFLGLELSYQFGDSIPSFTKEVRETIDVELNKELVKLLEEFNEIVTIEEDVRYLLDDEYLAKLREMLQEIDMFFSQDEDVYTDEEVVGVLDNPKSLVVFLYNDKTGKSYVEEDYEVAQAVDRKEAKLAVKHLLDYYSKHVEPRRDRQDSKSDYEGIKLLHTKAGHRARSYYLNMSVSEVVKLFLREKYGTDEVYLYTGFINIGNHGENYADGQYNRMRKRYKDIVYLMKLFNKKMLTERDKQEISGLIEGAIDITKKLNKIDGVKRYE